MEIDPYIVYCGSFSFPRKRSVEQNADLLRSPNDKMSPSSIGLIHTPYSWMADARKTVETKCMQTRPGRKKTGKQCNNASQEKLHALGPSFFCVSAIYEYGV